MNNTDVFKKETEQFLQEIKKAKLDILILQRQNENLCQQNNTKIEEFQDTINSTEKELELNLKESGERKIETIAGYCAYRAMPDKWEYDEVKIIDWCKENNHPYYHIKEILERLKLKNAINDNTIKLNKPENVPGITVTPQEPKFNYKLNGGL